MMGFLLFFGVVFVLVLACSSSTRSTTVTRIDPETQEKTIEIHETNEPTAGQTAARTVVWIAVGLFVVFVAMVMTN